MSFNEYGFTAPSNIALASPYPTLPVVTPEMYGAIANGSTDSTTAIQNAVNHICAIGGELRFGIGTYVISAAISIPAGAGWLIRGAVRAASVISQMTSNTPIFSFGVTDVWGWAVTDLTLTWATQQASTDTLSCAFWFTGNTLSRYNFQIERCNFSKGFRAISNNPSVSVTTWGCSIRDCVHFGTMTGGFANFGQLVAGGQPNIEIDGLYIDATNMAAAESCIYILAGDTCTLDHIEVNQTLNGNKVLNFISTTCTIGSIKLEVGTYGDLSNSGIFEFGSSHVNIGYLALETLTVTLSASYCLGIWALTTSSVTIAQSLISFASISGGNFYLANAAGYPENTIRFLSAPFGLIGTSNVFLTNVMDTTAPEGVIVTEWAQPRLSADQGDANSTWAIGVNPSVIQYLTTLTAGRTVTLTDAATGNDSNLVDGVQVTVVRNAGTPGAFTLAVNDASSNNIGNLASTNGSLTFQWQRWAWRLINKSVWTGTGT